MWFCFCFCFFCVLATRNNCRHFWHRGILAAAAAVGLTLVVSEGVSQEDEDKDDTEGGKGGAGDVKKPGCLGIFNCSI